MNQTYMKEKPILPLLLSMALPMVISMMVNSLYNIVDSYFVARISGEAMTALSLVYPIQNLSPRSVSALESESMPPSPFSLAPRIRKKRMQLPHRDFFSLSSTVLFLP